VQPYETRYSSTRTVPTTSCIAIILRAALVASLRAALPEAREAPAVRRRRLRETWGFTELEFRDVANAGLLVEIEETVGFGAAPAQARKWWTGEIARLANTQGWMPLLWFLRCMCRSSSRSSSRGS
jgi:aspartyl-tRNA(Asn)/glutamyl-tRNA(Gln) amidotransferase subunit B